MVAGAVILVENSIQMYVFYDDQLTVGNSWAWFMSAMPMLSNVLYSKWCGTIGPALWSIFENHPHRRRIYYAGSAVGFGLCAGIQVLMN